VSSITSSNARFSIVSPALPLTIAASQAADVTVRFAPNAAGSVSGALSIASNDPALGAVTVSVSGTGAGAPPAQTPSISVTPLSLDFGGVTVGQSKDLKFSIANTGGADLLVRSIGTAVAAYTVTAPIAPFTVSA